MRQLRNLEITDTESYYRCLRRDFVQKARRKPKPLPPSKYIQNMRMLRRSFRDIEELIGQRPAESGGLLISRTLDYTITDFIFDMAADTNTWVYQPNTDFLNSVLKGRNDEFVGIAHSHAKGATRLSSQDQNAAWSNMTSPGNLHLNAFLMPLIQTVPDTGRFEIIPYIVTCHPSGSGKVIVRRVELQIID